MKSVLCQPLTADVFENHFAGISLLDVSLHLRALYYLKKVFLSIKKSKKKGKYSFTQSEVKTDAFHRAGI